MRTSSMVAAHVAELELAHRSPSGKNQALWATTSEKEAWLHKAPSHEQKFFKATETKQKERNYGGARSRFSNRSSLKKPAFTVRPPKNRPFRSATAAKDEAEPAQKTKVRVRSYKSVNHTSQHNMWHVSSIRRNIYLIAQKTTWMVTESKNCLFLAIVSQKKQHQQKTSTEFFFATTYCHLSVPEAPLLFHNTAPACRLYPGINIKTSWQSQAHHQSNLFQWKYTVYGLCELSESGYRRPTRMMKQWPREDGATVPFTAESTCMKRTKILTASSASGQFGIWAQQWRDKATDYSSSHQFSGVRSHTWSGGLWQVIYHPTRKQMSTKSARGQFVKSWELFP